MHVRPRAHRASRASCAARAARASRAAWKYALIGLLAVGCSSSSSPADQGAADTGTSPADATPVADDAGITLGALPSASGGAKFAIPGRVESDIEIALPSPMPASPPIVIAFHGTGGEPAEGMALAADGASRGAIVIAPRAGYRAGSHPADVDHDVDEGGSSWNLWGQGAGANEDLRYVLSLVASAKVAYGADTSRVYTVGFSNGAFMAYFVAASLPDAIAGFAESSGGWTTDACPTRYGAISDGIAFMATTGPAPGVSVSCASLYASTSPAFPTKCIPSATNRPRPPPLGGRVPFGYLAHYSDDDTVSVQWSCFLGDALGARAQVTVRHADADGTRGHSPPPDFFARAWAFFAGRTNRE